MSDVRTSLSSVSADTTMNSVNVGSYGSTVTRNNSTLDCTLNEETLIDGLKITYTNADSLRNKIDELQVNSATSKTDIVIITETLPKNRVQCDVQRIEIEMEGYSLFSQDLNNYVGRGVAIYIKEPISAQLVTTGVYHNIEVVSVSLKLKNTDWLIIHAVYRSPNSQGNYINELSNVLKYERDNGTKFTHRLIVGDFNFKDINWDTEMTEMNENHP
ncbi:MAG: hypothetical protein ABW185_27795, partial [Sedimenticola sp.]